MEKVEQDIINVLQFNQTIPVEHLRSLLDLTVKMTSADRPSFPRAWSQATLQLVELDLGVNQYTNAESVLNDVERFLESTAFEERDSLTGVVLLLKMKLYFQTGSYDLLRLLYFRLAGQPQVLPQRRLSEAMQIAGHLFMHDGDWTAAHRAFMFAFLNDRSSGQRALRLKYTIIASILTGSLVDMFADNEVRLFLRDEQVRVCSLLMECFQRRDAIGFAKAINDNASVFKDDANTNPYIVALLRKSRVEALREYTSSFTRISFPSIARHIGVDEKGVEELCRYALINGLIAGRIDSLTPSLTLFDSRQTSENARLAALNKWADALKV
ncbi:COP9 signalosome complex subunit 2 [Angomonas deanei]|nr:COP9 signalosome complex subunit 2 [Angomonas deanei]|eukprot:EPY33515.1 COP9 signalosome complex subunit 2 [Angomonas deanei]